MNKSLTTSRDDATSVAIRIVPGEPRRIEAMPKPLRGKIDHAAGREILSIGERRRKLLRALRDHGRLSRQQLHDATGVRINTVGNDIKALLRAGIVQECETEPSDGGRPRTPLEIDMRTRQIVGLAIRPNHAEICSLNLSGELARPVEELHADDAVALVERSARTLMEHTDPSTIGVGMTVPGLIDTASGRAYLSAAFPKAREISLVPICQAVHGLPLVINSLMVGMGAEWLLANPSEWERDVILIHLDDGRVGAVHLTEGRPAHGSIGGSSEIGHFQLPVETATCYCGQVGCLERVFSSEFLSRNGGQDQDLTRHLEANDLNENVKQVLSLTAMCIANVVNVTKPNKLVVLSESQFSPTARRFLADTIRRRTFSVLADIVEIDFEKKRAVSKAQAASRLALTSLYYDGWV